MKIQAQKLAIALACAALLGSAGVAQAAPRDHQQRSAATQRHRSAPQQRSTPRSQRQATPTPNRSHAGNNQRTQRAHRARAPQRLSAPQSRTPQARRAPLARAPQVHRTPQARIHRAPQVRHAPRVHRAPRVRHARSYYRGGHLPRGWAGSPRVVHNWRGYRGLYQPPRGYQWVRGDSGDMLLVAIATGVITSIVLNSWVY